MGIRNLVGQTAIYGLPTIIGRLLNYLLVPLYTRLFVPAEYGVVTELYAYVAFLMVIATYGMETAFFRFSSKEKDNPGVYSTAVWMLLFSSIILFAVAFLFKDGLASAIGYADHSEYIVWFALILALDAICAIPFARLRNQERPLRFATLKTVNIAANIGFNLFFLVVCPWILKSHPDSILQHVYHPQIGVGYIFISNLLASIITTLLLLPEFFQIRWSKLDRKLADKMFMYAFPVMIWGMAGIVNETFDRILLKYLLPDELDPMAQLGIYGACYKVSILMTLFIQAFRFAAEPFFFKQAENRNAPEVYAKVMRYFVLACLVIFLGCSLFLNDIMLFVGANYREGAVIVPVLLMANLFLGVFYNLSVWYKITDQTKYGAYISLIGAAITIGLNILLVPYFGYIGAAWATLVCYVAIALISYWLGQRHFPIPYPVKALSLYTVLALLFYAVHHYVLNFESAWLNRGLGVALILCFVGVAWRKERRKLNGKC
ncbi:MAG: flippase [Bacteroidales bacterium]|jgi:O-antigen/teichoic acid export membrane protein|nr:flippase [Bacteroidales bacterium]